MGLFCRATQSVLFVFVLMATTRVYGQPPVPGTVEPGQIEKYFEPRPRPPPKRDIIVPPSPAERVPPEAEGIRFVLSDIAIDGMTVYSKPDLTPVFQSYLGKEVSLAQVYEIAQSLTARYRNDGYILSQVIVPPQRIRNGIVRLQAIEGYIDQVKLQGDPIDRPSLVIAYVDKIKASRPLRAKVLERYLLMLNDLPGVVARGTLLPAERQPGASDLIVTVSQRKIGASFGITNRASDFLGPWQANLHLAANSVLGLYEYTSLLLVTSLGNDRLRFGSLSHGQLLGAEGTAVNLYVNGVDAKPGLLGVILQDIVPRSISTGITFSHPLIRTRTDNLHLRGGFTYFNGVTEFSGITLFDDRIRAFRVGATYDVLDRWYGSNVVDLELGQGVDVLDASDEDSLDVSRPGAPSDFTKLNLYAARLQSLTPTWSVFGAVTGQYAFNKLLSPEEFSYGGEPFGRGYDPSELVGDSGGAVALELRYQGPRFTDWVNNYLLYAFYDAGIVWRRDPGIGEERDESAMSAGLGLRFNLPYGISGFVEYAQPLTREVAAEGDDDARFFMGIAATY